MRRVRAPSLFEPWGLVVNEVMNAGRPVIVSDQVGCAADLVQSGVNGEVFKAGCVEQLSEILSRVVRARFGLAFEGGCRQLSTYRTMGIQPGLGRCKASVNVACGASESIGVSEVTLSASKGKVQATDVPQESHLVVPIVVFVQRRRRPFANFSLEQIFDDVRQRLSGKIKRPCASLPSTVNGIIRRVLICLSAWRCAGDVYHVTGDINFAALAVPSKRCLLTVLDCGFLSVSLGDGGTLFLTIFG